MVPWVHASPVPRVHVSSVPGACILCPCGACVLSPLGACLPSPHRYTCPQSPGACVPSPLGARVLSPQRACVLGSLGARGLGPLGVCILRPRDVRALGCTHPWHVQRALMATQADGMELAQGEWSGWRHPTACRAGTRETSQAKADLGFDAGRSGKARPEQCTCHQKRCKGPPRFPLGPRSISRRVYSQEKSSSHKRDRWHWLPPPNSTRGAGSRRDEQSLK